MLANNAYPKKYCQYFIYFRYRKDKNCWSVNYVNRTICALQGSSVNILSEYSYSYYQKPMSKFWFKIKRRNGEGAEKQTEVAGRVGYHDRMNNHTLRIKHLQKYNLGEYTFRLQRHDGSWKESAFPGVTLTVKRNSVELQLYNRTDVTTLARFTR